MKTKEEILSDTHQIKAAKTVYQVHPFITKRWSPRSFSPKEIKEEQLLELFEAASWAPSSNNEQPWEYYYALKGTEGFEKIWNCLLPGNMPWTKNASVLFVALARTTFAANSKPNNWAMHDLGMANAQLFLQAAHRDIYGHLMAGFDIDKTKETFGLSGSLEPVCIGALGYLGEAEALEEPFKQRELTPRKRKPLNEFTKALK